MTEFESKCYGMSEQDIQDQYLYSITARVSGPEIVVMGILSDCQELQEMAGSFPEAQVDNTIRQYLNRAKYILSTMMEKNRA